MYNYYQWLAILTEEIGELATEYLEDADGIISHLNDELIQVAAVAQAWATSYS